MSINEALLKQAQTTQVETDHSEVASYSGARTPAEGKYPARLIGYVELGVQPQPEFKGKEKDPCLEVELTFECFGKNNMDEITDTVDGVKVTHQKGRILRLLPMAIKLNDRAKFFKMFKDMDYGRGLNHMSKMLNDVFLLTVSHKESKNGNKYAVLDRIESPLVPNFDKETGEDLGTIDLTPKCPPATFDFRLFIVEKPTFEQWESIFMDGTIKYKETVDGKEVEVEKSKNVLQEKLKSSLDWNGSAMQTLLAGLDKEPEPKKTAEPKAEKVKETALPAPASGAEDLLAEMGL